jgi:ribosome-associated protein
MISLDEIIDRISISELRFRTSRSGGPGGQNVNKVSTRVELRFDLVSSTSLTYKEKVLLQSKLKNRINSKGELVLVSQSERTQSANKRKVLERFYKMITDALRIKPARIAGSPTKASDEKRLDSKKRRGSVKKLRKPGLTED